MLVSAAIRAVIKFGQRLQCIDCTDFRKRILRLLARRILRPLLVLQRLVGLTDIVRKRGMEMHAIHMVATQPTGNGGCKSSHLKAMTRNYLD